eukprot:14444761-Alexandrium_andersonii.AAC.1
MRVFGTVRHTSKCATLPTSGCGGTSPGAGGAAGGGGGANPPVGTGGGAVSYTHLTLPTICSV